MDVLYCNEVGLLLLLLLASKRLGFGGCSLFLWPLDDACLCPKMVVNPRNGLFVNAMESNGGK